MNTGAGGPRAPLADFSPQSCRGRGVAAREGLGSAVPFEKKNIQCGERHGEHRHDEKTTGSGQQFRPPQPATVPGSYGSFFTLNASNAGFARWTVGGLLTAHFALLALTLGDYRVSIDSGYHVSLGRYYAEHGTAWWDAINWGPGGRPNLQGPLLHVGIAILGRLLGGSGEAFVLANALLALLQWVVAALTMVFLARRCGGDWTAFFAVALFTGSGLASLSYSVGLPSGWIFICTAWAIWFFIRGRWLAATLSLVAACYVHLAGFVTAPTGIVVAAVLLGQWRRLVLVAALAVICTLPYLIHFGCHLAWYRGEPGHVALDLVTPLIYVFAIPGFLLLLARTVAGWRGRSAIASDPPDQNRMLSGRETTTVLLAWVVAPTAWLFHDPQRFFLQGSLAASVVGGFFIVRVFERWRGHSRLQAPLAPALRVAIPILVVAQVFPLSIPGFLPELSWTMGLRFPRMLDWREARSLATILYQQKLDNRLIYVYNHSFAPALAVWSPLTFERGHWVEVQPRPDPADQLSAGVKAYVMPLPREDATLQLFEREGLLTAHGGTERSCVLTLTHHGNLRLVARLLGETASADAQWLADNAVNNTLAPIEELTSSAGITGRRSKLLEQRIHAGRITVAALVYAHALEPEHPDLAHTVRGSVRAFASLAAFLSDEAMVDFQSEARHRRLRENFRLFAEAVAKLGNRVLPFQELDEACDRLFRDYFRAA